MKVGFNKPVTQYQGLVGYCLDRYSHSDQLAVTILQAASSPGHHSSKLLIKRQHSKTFRPFHQGMRSIISLTADPNISGFF